jgi:long-subunit acyl-CoA synthetase (AMP-forming)
MADGTVPRSTLPEQNRAGSGTAAAKSAYHFPLIIKHLWHAPLRHAVDQEIVYRDLRRFTYHEFRERVGRLASALARMGVQHGDTVGVLDWDSNRFLEAFLAVPMMGAVLQTVMCACRRSKWPTRLITLVHQCSWSMTMLSPYCSLSCHNFLT